jgi:hypothetical protein
MKNVTKGGQIYNFATAFFKVLRYLVELGSANLKHHDFSKLGDISDSLELKIQCEKNLE